MIQLDDTTYAELLAKAQRAEEWEAKEQERQFEMIRLEAEIERHKLGLAVRRMFGPSSERIITGQESLLFNEVEAEFVPDAPEPLRQVKAHVRGGKRGGQRALDLGGLEIREVEYELTSEEQVCPVCSGPVRKIGEEDRIKIEIAPIQVTVTVEKQAKYCCCNPDNHPLKTQIIRAALPPTAFPKSMASASAVAHIMHQKYVMGSPLYRQEQELARIGFPLSRQTMANWVVAGAGCLDIIYLRLQKRLLKEDILHADETILQVLNEPDSPPTSPSFMWLYRTGRYAPPIVLYDYQPTRAREHPATFLKEFNGYLHVDGYPAYEKIPNITLCGCWAHARRKFVDAIALLPAEKRKNGLTKSHEGLVFCERLFEIERDLHDVAPEQRRVGRQESSQPVLDAYRQWLDKTVMDAQQKSPLGEAVRYSIRQWVKLTAFLDDGRLEIDNNRAERSIKPYVTGRKNWLFANTPTGADASATIYSIVETAKENGLDPRAYLQFLFEKIPTASKAGDIALDMLLPWEEQAQLACRIPPTKYQN